MLRYIFPDGASGIRQRLEVRENFTRPFSRLRGGPGLVLALIGRYPRIAPPSRRVEVAWLGRHEEDTMKAYVIFDVEIDDPIRYQEYRDLL